MYRIEPKVLRNGSFRTIAEHLRADVGRIVVVRVGSPSSSPSRGTGWEEGSEIGGRTSTRNFKDFGSPGSEHASSRNHLGLGLPGVPFWQIYTLLLALFSNFSLSRFFFRRSAKANM